MGKVARKMTGAERATAAKVGSSVQPLWDAEKGPSDEQVDAAMRVLRAEYWHDVRSMARELVREAGEREGDGTAWEMFEAIREACDGCERVIYTWRAQLTVLCSNHDAREDARDSGTDAPSDEQLAYLCLVHDVEARVAVETDEVSS